MIRSMTGFGIAKREDKKRLVSISIRSYNSKYLTVDVQLPKDYIYLEALLLRDIKKYVHRGRVVCNAIIEEKVSNTNIFVDWGLLDRKIEAIKDIKDKYKLDAPITISDLILTEPSVLSKSRSIDNDKEIISLVRAALTEALEHLLQSKETEGAQIYKDLQPPIAEIEKNFETIVEHKDVAAHLIRERLSSKLETMNVADVEEERILKELVIYLDKLDITEEINRFNGFIDTFKSTLESDSVMLGKKLDFILQEMIREINTIASKTNVFEITQAVINIKTEIEKLREQVQNVE